MTTLQIQALLLYHGFNPGALDGVMGQNTQNATRLFQQRVGLTADGKPGPATQKALKEYINTPLPEQPATSQAEPVADNSAAASEHGAFWAEIKHFTPEEFKCKCGGRYCNGYPAEPEEKLVRLADKMRDHFGNSVFVSSGLRCPQHNANVGGVSNSRHLSGKAMDFSIRGFSAASILAWTQAQPGIRYSYNISGGDFVHMDVQ